MVLIYFPSHHSWWINITKAETHNIYTHRTSILIFLFFSCDSGVEFAEQISYKVTTTDESCSMSIIAWVFYYQTMWATPYNMLSFMFPLGGGAPFRWWCGCGSIARQSIIKIKHKSFVTTYLYCFSSLGSESSVSSYFGIFVQQEIIYCISNMISAAAATFLGLVKSYWIIYLVVVNKLLVNKFFAVICFNEHQ